MDNATALQPAWDFMLEHLGTGFMSSPAFLLTAVVLGVYVPGIVFSVVDVLVARSDRRVLARRGIDAAVVRERRRKLDGQLAVGHVVVVGRIIQVQVLARLQRQTDPFLWERLHDFDDLANRLLRVLMGRPDGPDGGQLPRDRLDVARSGVVGDADRPVAAHGRAPDQLDRRQLAVAQEGVGVEVVESVRHRAPGR